MLDSNLPIYYYKPSTDKDRRFEYDVLFSQFDSDPEPRYVLRHPDPSQPVARNVYAAAIVDAYIPDIVFGEVLIEPQWTQPTLSQEEIRKNGGVPPPPSPIIPQDFTIQLYGPDQQIVVTEKPASFTGTPTYHFSMPQHTFRAPSASVLDRVHDDPAADVTTPKLHFTWKKDGKFAKDLTCNLTGRSTDNVSKKKGGKEPSIAVALFSGYRDLAIYEPNLQRVDVEDYKGLEVVLLLSAAVIKDIYCGQKKDCFNVGQAPRKTSSGLMRKSSSPLLKLNTVAAAGPTQSPPRLIAPAAVNGLYQNSAPIEARRNTAPSQQHPPLGQDPRAQWEIDAESARLRAQQDAEERALGKAAEKRRKAQEKADREEAKRIQKMLDAEDRESQRRQAEIDRETERLRKEYGDQANLLPTRPPRPVVSTPLSGSSNWQQRPQQQNLLPPSSTHLHPYKNPAASQSSLSAGGSQQPNLKPKRSFFGLRSADENETQKQKLQRKRSSVW